MGDPSVGTERGGGDHDGGGVVSTTQGARDVLVLVARDELVLGAVQVAVVHGSVKAVVVRGQGHAQAVGSGPTVSLQGSSRHPCEVVGNKETGRHRDGRGRGWGEGGREKEREREREADRHRDSEREREREGERERERERVREREKERERGGDLGEKERGGREREK